jgi:hypothetical protein
VNQAVEQVETPFFAKLDGDDVLIPGYLETVFPIIAARPKLAVLAGHEFRIGAEEALEFRPDRLPKARARVAPRILSDADAFRFILEWSPNPTSSGVIYRTAAFRHIGGFDPAINWGEDWEIWLRFARNFEVGYVDAPSALYRIHPQSSTAISTRQNRLCYGYDAVFRRALEVCQYPEVLPLIRRRMLGVVKLYAAAASRELRRPGKDALKCGWNALRALSLALGTLAAAAPSADGSRSRAIAPVRPTN